MDIAISKGLDIPICGEPEQSIQQGNPVTEVALLGFDTVGLKPSMAVRVGDKVAGGQRLFTDKQNPGVQFTAPRAGRITAIHRGPRRHFESIVIKLEGDEQLSFSSGYQAADSLPDTEVIKDILVASGQWTALRTRPYGKIPALNGEPPSLFITAMDSQPLAADPAVIINAYRDDFVLGLRILQALTPKTFLCVAKGTNLPGSDLPGLELAYFSGPHPAGLVSTHIHFLDPICQANKEVWHIGYQDVIATGHLFRTGTLQSERVIALSGPAMPCSRLIKTLAGASIAELCRYEAAANSRLIAGSVLTGHPMGEAGVHGYLGRYQQQVCALPEKDGSGFLNWLRPGRDRYSSLPLFLSSLTRETPFPMSTATWGGRRAILPIGTYEKVMPLNFITTALLKSIATGNTEKAADLGCLELVEEDLALCSFVCPGKNNFGPMLRDVLTKIEEDG
jgi:Na+-transporting NADH:ubiquinone oxidoreductase subunit A